MKKLVLVLSSLLILTSCGNTNSDNSIKQELKNNQLVQMLEENQVILNLTPNGLYNGAKGNNLENYYVENGLLLTLSVGEALPEKDEITSSVKDNEFAGWAYINDEDETISYTTSVIEGIKMYHATWNYTGDYSDIGNQTTQSTTTTNPTTDTTTNTDTTSGTTTSEIIERIYFVDKYWWHLDGAETYVYVWNSQDDSINNVWPGIKMTHLVWDGEYIADETKPNEKGRNLRYFDFDTSLYDSLIFVRVSPNFDKETDDFNGKDENGGDYNYGAQTVDITYDPQYDLYELDNDPKWMSENEKATVTPGVYDEAYWNEIAGI